MDLQSRLIREWKGKGGHPTVLPRACFLTMILLLPWSCLGRETKLFCGFFCTPDDSNLSRMLQEDAQTVQSPQVSLLASLVNDKKDRTTLKEIFNLVHAAAKYERPPGFRLFTSTATQILSRGYATGCTDFAIAFATLARAKGLPAVIVDSADQNWIASGMSLNNVSGHFFVEVYVSGKWLLVDSSSGRLYSGYDRGNHSLPGRLIAFAKALSVMDMGADEKNHNRLQRAAFLGSSKKYHNPGYSSEDMNDVALVKRMRAQVKALSKR